SSRCRCAFGSLSHRKIVATEASGELHSCSGV
ncbi:hypothetical protein Csa_023930, partial [Cucumis sativus]